MSGFQITITDAGRAALINAQNTGTVAFVLSQIGVSTQAIAGDLAGLTALPNERKRLATMAGDVVADDTLHVTIRDESADAYALRSFGLYASTGVLFAVYSQADPILEKSAAAMLLLAVDARLVALGTANVEFGPVGFTLPPASETVAGVVGIATDDEVDAGVDPWRVISARTLKRALQALSGFALKDHKHDAADTTSGVFNVGRIPALAMEKITGLAVALANKADKDHKHDAADTTSGVFNVARIPSLAMEKITGLVAALGGKADASSAIVMRGSLGGADLDTVLGPGGYRQATAANAQLSLNYPINNDGGSLLVVNPSSDTGYQTYHSRVTNRMWTRPFLAGGFYPWAEHWTSANFDPATKADANNASVGFGVISSGVNLNSLTEMGVRRQSSTASATLALNYPEAGVSGTLITSKAATSVEIGSQFYVSRTSSRMWLRAFDQGTFSAWDEVATLSGAYFTGNSGVRHSGFAHFSIDSAAGQNRDLRFNTNGVTRWSVRATSAAETGGNSGSNYEILRYADNGNVIGVALSIDRQTGESNFRAPLKISNTNGGSGNFTDGVLLRLTNFAPGILFEDSSSGTSNALVSVDSSVLSVRGDPNGDGSFDALAAQIYLNQPTAPRGNNTVRLATTAFVQQEIGAIPAPPNASTSTRGLALLATNAQTQAGTDGGRAITPAALWSFAKSIAFNGYAQIPGTPLVIQWGRYSGSMSEGQKTVMLPIAFGGGCLSMHAIAHNTNTSTDMFMQVGSRHLDRLIFMVNHAGGSGGPTTGFDWFALGLATGTPDPAYSSGFPPGGGGGGGEIIP